MSQKFYSVLLRPRQYALLIGCGINEEQTGVKKNVNLVELGQSAEESGAWLIPLPL